MASISSIYARCLAQHLLRNGVESERVFSGTRTDYPGLWQNDDLDLEVFRRILENAEEIGTDPPVGFLIGSYHNTWVLGPLGAAMGAAPTIRASLQLLETFTRLHTTYVQVESLSSPHSLTVNFRFEEVQGDSLRHHVESTFCFLERFVELKRGQQLDDAVYRVSYSPPAYAGEYARYLHSAVLFEQDQITMEFPLAGLDDDLPYYHTELWQSSLQQLSERLHELGTMEEGVYSDHVFSLLRSHNLPLPALGDIAGRLNISERTLNRRLQAEGTNFRELRCRAIDRWAMQYLEQTNLSVEAIAAVLGYQDAANFRRAFRKRIGVTPGQYRKEQKNR